MFKQEKTFVREDNIPIIFLNPTPFEITPQQLQQLNSATVYGHVSLGHGRLSQFNLPQALRCIDEWQVKTALMIDKGYQPMILYYLSDIRFPKLRMLSLKFNRIASIEVLSAIYMPELSEIYLDHNHISSIKAFRKNHLPSLTKVELTSNPLKDNPSLASLSQFYITRRNNQVLSVEYDVMKKFKHKMNCFLFEDFWSLKLQVFQNSVCVSKERDLSSVAFNDFRRIMGKVQKNQAKKWAKKVPQLQRIIPQMAY